MLGRKSPTQEFDKLKTAAVQARLPYEREAWLNLAFYLDEQYVEWSPDTNAIRRIPRDRNTPNAPRPVVNKIMHFVQQEKAMVLQAKPVVDVLPATDDLIDITESTVAKAYCQYASEPVMANFDRQLGRASLWAIIAGDGYLKWVWDPNEKRVSIVPVSMFELAVDPYADDFSKARYVIHSKFMDQEQVYDAFGVKPARGGEEQADPMRTALLRGMGSAPVVTGVTVNELWHKPCRKYPQGLYTVWAGNDFLIPPGPHPYEHKRLPFTQIGCIERPDSMHYMSPVKYLRSAQMELNKYHQQRIMIREAFAAPKWWVPSDLELEEQPNDSPRQVLRGHSMGGTLRPEIIQPSTYPSNDDGAMIEAQMMHIVGLHEVSQAQVPGRVEAAKAIEMLKEADADRQATMLGTINSAISEGFFQVLQLARQFETEQTLVTVYSREGLPEVKRFKRDAIKPGQRVTVTMGTGLARSRAARQDQLYKMWEQGIITDQEQMAELLELPSPSFGAPRMVDARLARNENLVLAQGQAIVPNSWDEHSIHLREHNDYRKTQDYLLASDDVKKKYEHHCQMHEQMELEQLAKLAQKAQLMAAASGQGQPQQQPGQPQQPQGDQSATPPQ